MGIEIIRCAIIAALAYAVYHKTLMFSAVCDDLNVMIATHQPHKSISKWKTKQHKRRALIIFIRRRWLEIIGYGYYPSRPKFKGQDPPLIWAHAYNIVFHTIVCTLIYFAFGRSNVSFLAAIIFCIMPHNHECSIMISGRCYTYTALFVMLMYAMPVLTPFIFLPGLAINVIHAPVMFLTYPMPYKLLVALVPVIVLWRNYNAKKISTPPGTVVPGIARLIPNEAFSFAHNAKLLAFTDNKEAHTIAWRKIIPMLKWLGYYFSLAVLGHKLAMFHAYNGKYLIDADETKKVYNNIDIYLIIGVLVLLTTLALIPAAAPHTAAWGLLWFVVNAIAYCNFVNVGNMLTTSRYVYIANAGVALAVAHVSFQYPVVGGAAVGWYLARTVYAMMQYRNEYWSNSFAVMEEPYYEHSWILHGNQMFARKNFKAAAQDYVEALRFYPNSFKANYNLSGVLLCMGDLQRAIACLEQAKKCHLMGQRDYAESMIANREKIIGIVYEASKAKKPYDLKMRDIPIVV